MGRPYIVDSEITALICAENEVMSIGPNGIPKHPRWEPLMKDALGHAFSLSSAILRQDDTIKMEQSNFDNIPKK